MVRSLLVTPVVLAVVGLDAVYELPKIKVPPGNTVAANVTLQYAAPTTPTAMLRRIHLFKSI
jgi:hypothetical protein